MWIDEYKELLFGYENDDEKTNKAVKLKNENMPEIFYKYRMVCDDTLDAFNNDILYFSAISMFNDPYECAMALSYNLFYDKLLVELRPFLVPEFSLSKDDFSSQDELVSIIEQGLRITKEKSSEFKTFWKLNDDILRAKAVETAKEISLIGDEIYRVCSFSELNDSLLMWAHYANNHQGFCISYNFKELNNDLTDVMLPVIYSDELLEIGKHIFPYTNKYLTMNAITRKSKVWDYEEEWRMLKLQNNNKQTQPQKVPIPKSVFLGARISDKDKSKIIKIASKKDIAIYQMHMEIDKFKLYPQRI